MKNSLPILLLLISFFTFSQDRNGFIAYQVTRGSDTTSQEMFFNSKTSISVRYPKKTVKSNDSSFNAVQNYLNAGKEVKSYDYVYKNYQTGLMKSHEYLKNGNRVIVNDSIPENLPWKLDAETRVIGGYTCQKATTVFRCSDYTAWFSSAIPVNVGPWKLGGLPGAILELQNETVNEHYVLTGLAYPTKKQIPTMPSPSGKEKTYASYEAFSIDQQKEVKKLTLFIKSQNEMPADAEVRFEERECY